VVLRLRSLDTRVSRIALALQYVEKGAGTKKKRHITPTDWLSRDDNKTIVIDVGKKVKGWMKEQMKTVKPSMVARLQYGMVCKSIPIGFVPVGVIKDVATSNSWASFQHVEDYELNGLPEPEAEYLMNDAGKQVTSIYYVLPGPVDVEVEIQVFANGVNPDAVKNWLETLGP